MSSHRKAITAAYIVAGLYFGFVVVRDFDSILATAKAFFDLGPAWYATVATFAIAAAPLAFFVVAYMVHRMTKWWFVVIPAAYATMLTTGFLTIALAAYLIWYYAVVDRVKATPSVGT